MARRNAAKPATTTNGIPLGIGGVRKIYEATLQDRDTWFAAFGAIDEMRRTRSGKYFFEHLVASNGSMDWVWLEETVSEQSPSGDMAQLDTWHRTHLPDMPMDASDEVVGHIWFVATFTLVIAYLRALHPAIMPPPWWWEDMAAIRGEPFVDRDIADIVKDSFLENRDQEGIAVLLDSIRR